MPHCTVEKITYFQFKRGPSIKESWRFWRVFKQEEASVPNAFQWWVRRWNEEGSVTYKKATCPTFFSSHAWECCQSVSNLPAPKEVGTKHTQTSCMPDRRLQHILHTAVNDYLYKPQVQQEIINSERLLEICHQFLKLRLVSETCQTVWPVTRHILLSDT